METTILHGTATLQQAPTIWSLPPWHTTETGLELLRFGKRSDETPTGVIVRLLRSSQSLWYCGGKAANDVCRRKVSRRPGYIVAATAPGQRRILVVGRDGLITEVSETTFRFTRVEWSVLLARRS